MSDDASPDAAGSPPHDAGPIAPSTPVTAKRRSCVGVCASSSKARRSRTSPLPFKHVQSVLADDDPDATQPMDSQEGVAAEAAANSEPKYPRVRAILIPTKADRPTTEIMHTPWSIGRDEDNDMVVDDTHVSRKHAQLVEASGSAGYAICALNAPVYLCDTPESVSHKVEKGQEALLPNGQLVALLLTRGGRPVCQFKFRELLDAASFDAQYLDLLRALRTEGSAQQNKKGRNVQLPRSWKMRINLRGRDGSMALPITSLRWIQPRHALIEALWYLRGEDHIDFLQRHNCHFWDEQAKPHPNTGGRKTWVGKNYGLLGEDLEQQVLAPLVDGKDSRNMVVQLADRNAETVQQACTATVHFITRTPTRLDLMIHQRSSDVALGLPHDVVVWSVILHLVCREVRRRTAVGGRGARDLYAGELEMNIASAHNYEQNAGAVEKLLERAPRDELSPGLGIAAGAPGMFEIANAEPLVVCGRRGDRSGAAVTSDKRQLSEDADGDDRDLLWVEGYAKDLVHPPIKIAQANDG